MKDAPVTRPDLDALLAELEEVVILGDDPRGKELACRAMAALAAERARADEAWRDIQRSEQRYGAMAGERDAMNKQWLEMRRERDAADARADQAASEAVREYAQALEHNRSAENWGWSDFVRDAYEWSDWKSAAPTAEQ